MADPDSVTLVVEPTTESVGTPHPALPPTGAGETASPTESVRTPHPAFPPTGAGETANSNAWLWVWTLTLVGLVLRLFYEIKIHPVEGSLYSDMGGNLSAARWLAAPHHVWSRGDTIKPPGMGLVGAYLLHLSPLRAVKLWGVLQAILSAATLPLIFVGLRRFLGERAALLGTALMTFHFVVAAFVGFLMAETYLVFFLALSFALLVPNRPFMTLLSGVALGLGCVFKAQPTTLVPFWCAALWLGGDGVLQWRPGAWKLLFGASTRARLSAVALAFGMALLVVPESIWASKLVGHPVFLSAYGGQNVYVGHCHVRLLTCDGGPDGYFTSGVPKVYQRNEPWPDVTFHVPVFDSAFYSREGMKCFKESIGGAILWSAEQLVDVFAGWPGSTIAPWPDSWFPVLGGFSANSASNLILSYFYFPLAVLGFWLQRRRAGAWIVFIAPLAAVWAVALMFSGDPRYRLPYDFFILGMAAVAILRIYDRLRHIRLRIAVMDDAPPHP
jgi:hypothetical protein